MIKRMLIMLLAMGLLFGAWWGYRGYASRARRKAMQVGPPAVTVSTTQAEYDVWKPEIEAVGTLRAVQGVDVTSEVTGIVQTVYFQSGQSVEQGQALLQLNADTDIAQLHSLEAVAELARITYERDRKQREVNAISQAQLDADDADWKSKRAQVTEQRAWVRKKTVRAPFAGRVGISTVDPGQYINPGDKIVPLQALDPIYVDFFLPQQELSRLGIGQAVVVTTDTYPGREFPGTVTAINPQVDSTTRNVLVEATLPNPDVALLPGMYAAVRVGAGTPARYLTVPQTTVSFHPYGESVFVVKKSPQGTPGTSVQVAREVFVITGPTRGDQIAVLSGITAGDEVVTAGQLKLRSGSPVEIDNRIQPSNDSAPAPGDE